MSIFKKTDGKLTLSPRCIEPGCGKKRDPDSLLLCHKHFKLFKQMIDRCATVGIDNPCDHADNTRASLVPKSDIAGKRWARTENKQGDHVSQIVEQYNHHGADVWVRSALKGLHREHCLCFACSKLKIGSPDNCQVAQKLYKLCVEHNLVTPVWECPSFAAN